MKINFLLLSSATVAEILAACTEQTPEPGDTGHAIRFANVVTREAKEQFDNGDKFAVWGKITPNGGTEADLFVEPEMVTNSNGTWTYPNTRYWIPGNTYRFFALYPTPETLGEGVSVSYPAAGQFSVADFDAREGHDLMWAEKTGISVTERTPDPGAVSLSFSHLTACVEIVGKLDATSAELIRGFAAEVEDVKLYGIPSHGTYSHTDGTGEWISEGDLTNANSPFASYSATTGSGIKLTTVGVTVLGANAPGTAVLPLPGNLADAFVSIEYSTSAEGSENTEHSKTIPLATLGVSEWETGKKYRYTFTVIDENHIMFSRPSVSPWQDTSGGIIVVE